ncbi:MAG: phosphoribosyltransferase family protein [Verrucomicrobiales bacterium]
MESISVASYHGGTESSGIVTFNQTRLPDLSGEHVLLLDDILDSGRTLHAIAARVRDECRPESIKICVLLDKMAPRAEDVQPDYSGFQIGDEFVVGYGLDYQGRYRNLPLIGILRQDMI